MKIIKYKVGETTIEVGFKKYNFVVYGQIGIKEGYEKQDYIQKIYEQCKEAIDYEEDRYLSGKSNSILFVEKELEDSEEPEQFEEFSPSPASTAKLELIADRMIIQFMDGSESETVELSNIIKDQYGETMNLEVNYSTSFGSVDRNILTIPKVDEEIIINISATINNLIDIKNISIHPEIISPKIEEEVFNLEDAKNGKIYASKYLLADYLGDNPVQFSDGKFYSVTQDKQNLLSNAITVYQMKTQLGIPAELKWNATGEECTVWTLENAISLALAVAGYVEPLVAKQQTLEVQIRNCTSESELNEIVIDYEAV